MKNLTTLLIGLFLTGIIFTGCNKIKEIADVDFIANYIADLDVDMAAKSTDATFSVETTIDPLSNDNVKEYIDKIKDYEIQKVTVEVTYINNDANLVSGELDIFTDNNLASWTLSNLPLTQGGKLELGNENGQWETITKIFEEQSSFVVKLEGETDEDGLIFTIRLIIETKITANPL